MSYILLALKKADQERGSNPDSRAHKGKRVFAGPDLEIKPEKDKIKYAVAISVFLTFGLVIYVYNNGIPLNTVAEQKTSVNEESEIHLSEQPPGRDLDSALKKSISQSPVQKPTPVSVQNPSATGLLVPPELNVTGYIYFENQPTLSKVFVGGEVYRLGDRLPEGGIVSAFSNEQFEITSEGKSFWLNTQ